MGLGAAGQQAKGATMSRDMKGNQGKGESGLQNTMRDNAMGTGGGQQQMPGPPR